MCNVETIVRNGQYYKLEVNNLEFRAGCSEVQVGTEDGDIFTIEELTDNNFVHGQRVVYGFLDLTGEGDAGITFVILAEELENKQVELENILDSAETLEEAEQWILTNTKTNFVAYF